MMVEVLETSFVTPAEETPKHTIWLSNLDLVAPRSHAPMVIFYRNDGAAADFFSVDVLKAALAKTLVLFYPLAGRVMAGKGGSGRLEIRCTGEGARFVVARSDLNLSDLEDFGPSPEMRNLLVPREEHGEHPSIGMMVQVTFFKCGGVCLGTAQHRIMADGHSASYFMKTWSEIARGLEATAKPFFDRRFFQARTIPSITFDHEEYSPKSFGAVTGPFVADVLGLSEAQVDILKCRCCQGKTGLATSTYAAVVAHVWRCACAARELRPEQETRLFVPVDVRRRVRPPLPQDYVGNAIVVTSAAAKVAEVLTRPIGSVLEKCREAINRVNDEYVRSAIDYLETMDDMAAVSIGAPQLRSTDLWVVSWLNMKGFYELDFGWGDPVFVSRAQLLRSGFVYIMKNKEEDGGVLVSVGLEPDSMLRFQKNFYEEFTTKNVVEY